MKTKLAFTVACLVSMSSFAQTWESGRNTPALWEIIGVDRSGENNWPWLMEDIASDGLDDFGDVEQSVDVRSIYAAQDNDDLWLRFYVSHPQNVSDDLVAFLFINKDHNFLTGGSAAVPDFIWNAFDEDFTMGGYEMIVGFQSDGTVRGVWEWDDGNDEWLEASFNDDDAIVEAGQDRDPLLWGDDDHGYLQIRLRHSLSDLDLPCGASFLLRVWNNDTQDDFGDDDAGGLLLCLVPDWDLDGVPDIIEILTGCVSDEDCPGDGICIDHRYCLITFACADDSDCPGDEICQGGICLAISSPECQDDGDCDGFVCDHGECVPCELSGDRSCEGDRECSLAGICLEPFGCRDDDDCEDGYLCGPLGLCVADNLCFSNLDCDPGFICSPNGLCVYGDECTDDDECDPLEVCSQGVCVFGDMSCENDGDCDPGEFCSISGVCMADPWEGDCLSNLDCPMGEICGPTGDCIDVDDCSSDSDCGPGEICTDNGACAEGSAPCDRDYQCDEGEICSPAGACVSAEGPEVSGGACNCSNLQGEARATDVLFLALILLGLLISTIKGRSWRIK